MLAQSFMKPTDLGISDDQFQGLLTTLFALERGDLTHFRMDRVEILNYGADCYTPACILGWANHFSGESFYPTGDVDTRLDRAQRWPAGLRKIFTYDNAHGAHGATQAQAAIALRNYLTSGDPRWNEAMAD